MKPRFTLHPFAVCAAALFAPLAAVAAESVRLEPVVVTATRNPTPISQVLAAVTVIGRDEIERAQANDLAQLLGLYAGLDIGRNGGPGQPSSVFIRGGNSDHTLVLVDGVRVNPATFGGAALSLIAPEMIERIEIVKGPRSTLYGSDALAGVINIITRGAAQPRLSLSARAGSYGSSELAGSHAFGDDKARFSVHAQQTQSDGFPSFDGASEDRGYRLSTVVLRGDARMGAVKASAQVWRAEGNNEYLSQNLDFPPPTFDAVLRGFTPRDHDTLNQTAALTLAFSPLTHWQTRVQLSHSTDEVIENQGSNRLSSRRPELRLDNTVNWGAQRISFGANIAQDRADVQAFDRIRDERDLGAVYAQGEFNHGRHHAVAGASINRYDGFDDEVTGNLEYGFDAWTGARLIAAYGTGFRAPNANQRFTAFGGNPDLKPERSRSLEAGLRQTVGVHTVDLRAFRNEVRDLIAFKLDFSQPDFGDNLNLDRARTQGVELAYTGRVGAFEARLEGVVQQARDCSTDTQGNRIDNCDDGARLKRRSHRSISGALTWQHARGTLGIDATGSGDRRDFEGLPPFGNDVRNAGYGLLGASASLTLGRGVSLSLRGENLLDKDYTLANGYQQSSAAGYATLRYDL